MVLLWMKFEKVTGTHWVQLDSICFENVPSKRFVVFVVAAKLDYGDPAQLGLAKGGCQEPDNKFTFGARGDDSVAYLCCRNYNSLSMSSLSASLVAVSVS